MCLTCALNRYLFDTFKVIYHFLMKLKYETEFTLFNDIYVYYFFKFISLLKLLIGVGTKMDDIYDNLVLFCDQLSKSKPITVNKTRFWNFTTEENQSIYAWYLDGKIQQNIPQIMNQKAKSIVKSIDLTPTNAYILVISTKKILPLQLCLCDVSNIFITASTKNIKINQNTFYNNYFIEAEKPIKISNLQSSNYIVLIGNINTQNHLKAITTSMTNSGSTTFCPIPKFENHAIEEPQVPQEWKYTYGQNDNYYKKIQNNSKIKITKHLLKQKYYAETYSESIKKFDIRCNFCMMGIHPKDANDTLSGHFECLNCQKNGCFWHFTKDILCLICARVKNNWKEKAYNEIKTKEKYIEYRSMYYDHSQKQYNACAFYKNNFYIITNIPTNIQQEISINNGNNKKGFLRIDVECKPVNQISEITLKREKTGTIKVLKTLKEKYDEMYRCAYKKTETDIYLTDVLKPLSKKNPSRYVLDTVGPGKYLITKTAKMIDGDINYGTSLLTNSITDIMKERCLLWSSYIKHIIAREEPLKNDKGNIIGTYQVPNPTIVKYHEMAFENYFKYISNNKIGLLNQQITQKINRKNIISMKNTTSYSKIMLGNWYHTFDVSDKSKKGKRVTGVGLGSNGGIEISKLHGFDSFAREIFKIGSKNISLCLNTDEKLFKFNSIQINSSNENLTGGVYSPKFHWDSTSIYNIGIITLHLKGYNSFITNQDMFPSSIKELDTDSNKIILAEKVYKYGLIKEPKTTYVINNIATKYVNHAILNSKGLAIIRDQYNKYIKQVLTRKDYDIMKIKATAQEIRRTPTESWVLRNIPIGKK